MARAYIGNTPCEVFADKDLGDNWAISVIPPKPTAPGQAFLSPLVVKLQGEDREKCMVGALEILQKAGKIDRFDV
jgi:hypothetical protein